MFEIQAAASLLSPEEFQEFAEWVERELEKRFDAYVAQFHERIESNEY